MLEAGGVTVEICQNLERPAHLTTAETYTAGTVWDSAAVTAAVLDSLSLDFNDRRVVELGSGTGALGCLIARRHPTSRVLLTDLPYALPLLRANIRLNELTNATAKALSFGSDVPPDTDVLLCSDLLYTVGAQPMCWTELAFTIGSAVVRRRGSVCWLMLQERFGTQDIGPFFEALGTATKEEGGVEVTELQHPLLAAQACEQQGYFYWKRLFCISAMGGS